MAQHRIASRNALAHASTPPSDLPTGKVHGSLARAGKVRGQTPKVAKQDKKKLSKVSVWERVVWRLVVGRALNAENSPLLLHTPPYPQGRAMKRIKYNRRFVNVVVGMGKKKGPNSQ